MSPAPIANALAAEGIDVLIVRTPKDLAVVEGATAFVLDPASRAMFPTPHLRGFVDSGGAIVALGGPEETDVPSTLPAELIAAWLPHPYGPRQLLLSLRTAY